MDWFSLCLDTLCLEEQSVIHIRFLCRLTGRRCKVRHFAAYFLLLCGVEGISLRLSLDGEPAVAAGILALYSVSRFGLGNRRSTSWTAAVLAFYISQLLR